MNRDNIIATQFVMLSGTSKNIVHNSFNCDPLQVCPAKFTTLFLRVKNMMPQKTYETLVRLDFSRLSDSSVVTEVFILERLCDSVTATEHEKAALRIGGDMIAMYKKQQE